MDGWMDGWVEMMERALGPRNAETDDRLLQLQQINQQQACSSARSGNAWSLNERSGEGGEPVSVWLVLWSCGIGFWAQILAKW